MSIQNYYILNRSAYGCVCFTRCVTNKEHERRRIARNGGKRRSGLRLDLRTLFFEWSCCKFFLYSLRRAIRGSTLVARNAGT